METVTVHSDPGSFVERAHPWLLEREDEHNLILSLSSAIAARGGEDLDAFFATVEDDGVVVGCAVRTPPHKVLVTDMPGGAADPLAAALAERYDAIPAVLGPPEVAESIAAAWVGLRGGRIRPGAAMRLYRLDEVVPPTPVDGALRVAGSDDLELALHWADGFARDAGEEFRAKRSSVEGWIARAELWIWELDGAPRCMAVAQGRTRGGVRIGYVYTPPEHRRTGFGSACVAEVSQRMLDDGLRFCMLYTDLSNPTSNAIYQRLGYRPIADVRDFELIDDSEVLEDSET